MRYTLYPFILALRHVLLTVLYLFVMFFMHGQFVQYS